MVGDEAQHWRRWQIRDSGVPGAFYILHSVVGEAEFGVLKPHLEVGGSVLIEKSPQLLLMSELQLLRAGWVQQLGHPPPRFPFHLVWGKQQPLQLTYIHCQVSALFKEV